MLNLHKIFKLNYRNKVMAKVIPIGDRILLKPLNGEEKTKSGIYLPKNEDRKEGIVEEVGNTDSSRPVPLKKGDRIIYGGYSQEEIEIDGEKFLIIELKDVIARYE